MELKEAILQTKRLIRIGTIGNDDEFRLEEEETEALQTLILFIERLPNEEEKELEEALIDMVNQHCLINTEPFIFDSMALSANTYAIKILAKRGILKIDKECGRRIIARFVKKQSTNNQIYLKILMKN